MLYLFGMKSVGEVLKQARKRAGLSQNAVGRRAGMATSQVSQIEAGRRVDPQFSSVAKLAGVIGLSLDLLAAECGFEGFSAAGTRKPKPGPSAAALAESNLLAARRSLSTAAGKIDGALSALQGPAKVSRRRS